MRNVIFFMLVIFFINQSCFAGEVVITAKEISLKVAITDVELFMINPHQYESKILYINEYQIIYIKVGNNSSSILNVNPNHFTLVSNMKTSYAYSAETHVFNNKVIVLPISPLRSVDVYPETITEGFLLFEKKYENERPKKLYFKDIENHIGVDVILEKPGKDGEFESFLPKTEAKHKSGEVSPSTRLPNHSESVQQMATLKMISRPKGASIYVDDDYIGKTPFEFEVSAGEHTIMFQLQGHGDWKANLDLSKGGKIPLSIRLLPN